MSRKKGSIGASTGLEKTPERMLADQSRMLKEQARAAKKCGPVKIRFVDPATLKRDNPPET